MRLSIALLTMALAAASSSYAQACCLTNWLFGRTTPYAVGYAPQPYAVGYAPVVNPYAANPYTANPYATNYWPAQTTSVLQPSWTSAAPVLSSGVYQSQRPAYYDNPSVYTGLPVGSNAAPIVSGFRGTTPLSSYPANNAYPNTYTAAQAPIATQAPIAAPATAPGLPMTVTTPTGAPTSALPATPVAPLFAPTPPRRSGLSRFFGSIFGTNYRTAYYRAPVTYYRPATTVDPVSGTTVTVQQPCTSYAQQLQRTPYNSLQSTPTTSYPPAGSGCSTPGCSTAYSAAPYSAAPAYGSPAPATGQIGSPGQPSSLGQPGAVGQAGAIGAAAPGQYTVPIPSTAPAAGTYYGPGNASGNLAPLTGAPNTVPGRVPRGGGFPSGGPASGGTGTTGSDMAPVDQPQLRNRPAGETDQENRQPANPRSYWELQSADDSTAMIHHRQPPAAVAEPIHAPEDYVAPFGPASEADRSQSNDSRWDAPPLPARDFRQPGSAGPQNWTGAPIREASLARTPPAPPAPQPIVRDTTWKPAR